MKRKYELRITSHKSRKKDGSALILTVVLTTLLATIGVLFVLLSRLDKMAASAASENREINLAVETVVAKIKQELVLDVPGVAGEYYDYPGLEDKWLASLEPNDKRMWPQISDVTGYLKYRLWPARNILITNSATNPLLRAVIEDYRPIALDANGLLLEQLADADGDGVADSKWIELDNITSSKGRPIYAAIRIIDNGGMLNVNTAFKFNPADPCVTHINGASQLQINLMALAGRPPLPTWPVGNPYTLKDELNLRTARANGTNVDPYSQYQNSVIWSYGEPTPYTPFDISDELELRYRFLLNHTGIDTRLEGWGGEFRDPVLRTPVDSGGKELDKWFKRACFDPNILNPNLDSSDPNYYAYRHIATTCNMDRIINPTGRVIYGGKMVNVNTADAGLLWRAIYAGLYDANVAGAGQIAAQVAVNLIDFRDDNNDVTSFALSPIEIYYGFERPCIYISELAHNFVPPGSPTDSNHYSYAIELYKPYPEDSVPSGEWQLKFPRLGAVTINWREPNQFHVAVWEDSRAPLTVNSAASSQKVSLAGGAVIFDSGDLIELQRKVTEPNGIRKYITVDSIPVPAVLVSGQGIRSFERDIKNKHKCIRRLWGPVTSLTTLGTTNSYENTINSALIQAHPANRLFTNIGEIGMIFRMSAYSVGPNPIGPTDNEFTARLNLINPAFQQIFNYLTVIDPADHGQPPFETRIKGRINVNTTPWFVISQLPWVGTELAQAIVAYRDKLKLNNNVDYHTDIWGNGKTRKQGMGLKLTDPDVREVPGFASIDELLNVTQQVLAPMANEPLYDIRRYGRDTKDQQGFPDLTTDPVTKVDGAVDDFEERDLIFSRISNLVTVRSDIFTAYILVRIGANGPQRRVLAILDRSKVTSPTDKVKIIAIQPVPDPR